MTVSSIRIQRLAGIACLSALAFVLMMLEFPIIPVAAYLKLDFSDVPVLLGTLIYGPVSGIIIAAVKCLIHALVYGFSIGELLGVGSDFISSLALLLPFAWAAKRTSLKPAQRYLLGTGAGMLTLTVMPIASLVAIGVVPFNIIKGLLVGGVSSLLAMRLANWLAKHQM